MAHWGDNRSPNKNNSLDWQTCQNGLIKNQRLRNEMANVNRMPLLPQSKNAVPAETGNGELDKKAGTFETEHTPNPARKSTNVSPIGYGEACG